MRSSPRSARLSATRTKLSRLRANPLLGLGQRHRATLGIAKAELHAFDKFQTGKSPRLRAGVSQVAGPTSKLLASAESNDAIQSAA